jgi:molybdenum cofactor cytidylyltransferase
MNQAPAGILLAAGYSTRFGSNKLLYPVTGNQPMVLVSARKLAAALPGSVVVINRNLLSYQSQLASLGLRIVVNERPERGIGSSIACGVLESPAAGGWLVMLGDMPFVREDTIRILADRLRHVDSIVAPRYRQIRGHPVGFGKNYRDQLQALNGDTGARDIIHRYRDRLEIVPVDDAGVIADIDAPSDLG